ncbi:hypothetical protein ACKI10_43350 [Streptomyces galilaeus]|uniref:Rho termination factor N-terminal domain-containing protein n=1 Tax=Streptomyces galilaeus TaxID=33899 RepID=A0ABW9J2K7_STRGJ
MRVQFIRRVASPTLTAQPGQIIDLPDEQALKRIKAGHCTAVDQPKARLRDRLPGRRKEDAGPGDKPLDKLTVDQLKAYADEHDISLPESNKKADILAAVTAALEERQGTQQ